MRLWTSIESKWIILCTGILSTTPQPPNRLSHVIPFAISHYTVISKMYLIQTENTNYTINQIELNLLIFCGVVVGGVAAAVTASVVARAEAAVACYPYVSDESGNASTWFDSMFLYVYQRKVFSLFKWWWWQRWISGIRCVSVCVRPTESVRWVC